MKVSPQAWEVFSELLVNFAGVILRLSENLTNGDPSRRTNYLVRREGLYARGEIDKTD